MRDSSILLLYKLGLHRKSSVFDFNTIFKPKPLFSVSSTNISNRSCWSTNSNSFSPTSGSPTGWDFAKGHHTFVLIASRIFANVLEQLSVFLDMPISSYLVLDTCSNFWTVTCVSISQCLFLQMVRVKCIS